MDAFNNGSTLAAYDMERAELIGRGKFSVVHRTRRRLDAKQVALKKIQVFEMMDSKCRNECLNEIKLLQSLGHPNIVQYLDAFIEDNELHVAMELAERGDLGGLIKQAATAGAPLAEAQVWIYFAQVADALRYMHSQRVMHRDIKPANVFIMDSGCIQGSYYDWKSDIWSLGCLLYELATLRSPFFMEGLNYYTLGKKINKRAFEPISELYSLELRTLVDQMIQVDPKNRLDTEAVHAAAQQQLGTLSTPPGAELPAPMAE
ncbi:kinase-like domain-containing protein [Pavlovales sp. CCMP2436]|nr:kinase-like domain-containing protein [Pavlovales sp. CCMP2436]